LETIKRDMLPGLEFLGGVRYKYCVFFLLLLKKDI
jgi:hypothetical protein